MLLSSPVSSCALFGIYPPHPITNRQCLCQSLWYRLIFLASSLLVRRFISLLSFTFPTRLRFLTSIIKTTKTLYTFFYASSAPGFFVEFVTSLHHTALIPFSYVLPLRFPRTTGFNPHPFSPHMLTTFFVSKTSHAILFTEFHRVWSRIQYTCFYINLLE